MDDLDAVAFVERNALPISAPDNLMVEFDGETLGREFEMFDELLES
jgi:hypothetical protein